MLLCCYIKLISDGCSHAKSVDYFLDSINSPQKYLSYFCTSWEDFQTGKCDTQSTLHMGESIQLNPPSGKYYLSVPYFYSPFKSNTTGITNGIIIKWYTQPLIYSRYQKSCGSQYTHLNLLLAECWEHGSASRVHSCSLKMISLTQHSLCLSLIHISEPTRPY